MPRHLITGLVALGLLMGAAGCAYFNLFYNAKQSYNEAEEIGKEIDPRNQPTSAQTTAYQRTISKCRMLLDEYPDSDLVDDALVLIGKSQYHLKTATSYRDAIRNFDNVLANFPESELIEEVYYFKSLAHLVLGEEQVALDYFRLLRESFPNGKFGSDALRRLGDTYAERGQVDEAATYYDQFLTANPRSPYQALVVRELGRILIEKERYPEAVTALERLNRQAAHGEDAYDADFLRIRALREMGQSQEALDLLNTLREDSSTYKKREDFVMMEGRLQLDLGNEERGVTILEAAATSEGKTPPVEPRYRLLEYFLKSYGPDDPRVEEHLKAGIESKGSGQYMDRLRDRRKQLNAYQSLSKDYAAGDSTAHRAAFALAELLMTGMQRPQSALEYYGQVVELAPASALAPRAVFAMGYIHGEVLGDQVQAAATFDSLRVRYPESLQARYLAGEEFLEAKPRNYAVNETTGEIEVEQPGGTAGPFRGRPALDPRRTLQRGGPGASAARERDS